MAIYFTRDHFRRTVEAEVGFGKEMGKREEDGGVERKRVGYLGQLVNGERVGRRREERGKEKNGQLDKGK